MIKNIPNVSIIKTARAIVPIPIIILLLPYRKLKLRAYFRLCNLKDIH